MTAPTVGSSSNAYLPHSSAGTTFTFSLPDSYATGDRLVAAFAADFNFATVFTPPSGWTALGTINTSGTHIAMLAAYKDLVGGEAATAAFTTDANEAGGVRCWRIPEGEFDPAIAPEFEYTGTTNLSQADPAAITPTGGPKDFLYLTAVAVDKSADINNTVTGFPAGYTGTGAATDNGNVQNIAMGWAHLGVAGSTTEDPGAYTQSTDEQWVSVTIAIHPVASDTAPTKTAATVDDASATAYTLGAQYTQTCTEHAVAMPVGTADPDAAAIIAGTGATGTASVALTANTPDTYTLTPTQSPKHPLADIHRVASNAGGNSAITRHYDEPLDPPTGKEFVTANGLPWGPSITAITSANPPEITVDADIVADFWETGDKIWLWKLTGDWAALNSQFDEVSQGHTQRTITVTGTNTFTVDVDASAFGAFTSGGFAALDGSLFEDADPPVAAGYIAVIPTHTSDGFLFTLNADGTWGYDSGGNSAPQTITLDVFNTDIADYYGEVTFHLRNNGPILNPELIEEDFQLRLAVGATAIVIDLLGYLSDPDDDPLVFTLSPASINSLAEVGGSFDVTDSNLFTLDPAVAIWDASITIRGTTPSGQYRDFTFDTIDYGPAIEDVRATADIAKAFEFSDLVNLTNSGAEVYTATSGGTNYTAAGRIDGATLADGEDGWIEFTKGAADGACFLAFDTGAAGAAGLASCEYIAGSFAGGSLRFGANEANVNLYFEIPDYTLPSTMLAKVRLRRASGSIIMESTEDGANWTERKVFTSPYTGVLQCRWFTNYSGTAYKIYRPRAYGLTGLTTGTETTATAVLEGQSLVVATATEYSSSVDEGLATRTSPAAGTIVESGSTVTVYLSAGPVDVKPRTGFGLGLRIGL